MKHDAFPSAWPLAALLAGPLPSQLPTSSAGGEALVPYPLSVRLLDVVDGARRADPRAARTDVPASWAGLMAVDHVQGVALTDAALAALQPARALVDELRVMAGKACDEALGEEERGELDLAFQGALRRLDELARNADHHGIPLLGGELDVYALGRTLRELPVLIDLPDVRPAALGLSQANVRTIPAAYHALALLDVAEIENLRTTLELARQLLLDGAPTGGLREVQRILGRMRGLALRASDATLNSGARMLVDRHFRADAERIEHIASAATYAGVPLLDGSTDVDLQGAPPLPLTLAFDLPDVTLDGLGLEGATLLTISAAFAALASIEDALADVEQHRRELESAAEQLSDGTQLQLR